MLLPYIRRLRQIRRRVGQEVTQQLVLALLMSMLDYCNSMLAGLPMSTLEPLQRVQNAAARLVLGLGRFDHVTPSLIQLHWSNCRSAIQNQVQAVLLHPRNSSRSHPDVPDANRPVRLRQ